MAYLEMALVAELLALVEVVVVAFSVVVAYLGDLLAYLRDAFVVVLRDACLVRCGIVLVLFGCFLDGVVLDLLFVVYHVR